MRIRIEVLKQALLKLPSYTDPYHSSEDRIVIPFAQFGTILEPDEWDELVFIRNEQTRSWDLYVKEL